MVQFCCLGIYLGIETVSCGLICCNGWQGWKGWRQGRIKVGPIFSSLKAMPAEITKNIIMMSAS